MLQLAYRVYVGIDHALATPEQRMDARMRARHADRVYGQEAFQVLFEKLGDPRRRKSKRALRLAIAHLVEARQSVARPA